MCVQCRYSAIGLPEPLNIDWSVVCACKPRAAAQNGMTVTRTPKSALLSLEAHTHSLVNVCVCLCALSYSLFLSLRSTSRGGLFSGGTNDICMQHSRT